jgi:hypothetical protein
VALGLLMGAAVLVAVAVVGARRLRALRLDRADATRQGSSAANAIYIRSYTEMDDHLSGMWCRCGGYLALQGEGSREEGGRRFRVARLECQECERLREVYFDTTDLIH